MYRGRTQYLSFLIDNTCLEVLTTLPNVCFSAFTICHIYQMVGINKLQWWNGQGPIVWFQHHDYVIATCNHLLCIVKIRTWFSHSHCLQKKKKENYGTIVEIVGKFTYSDWWPRKFTELKNQLVSTWVKIKSITNGWKCVIARKIKWLEVVLFILRMCGRGGKKVKLEFAPITKNNLLSSAKGATFRQQTPAHFTYRHVMFDYHNCVNELDCHSIL